MSDSHAFSRLVPGFDFLQDLVKNAGAALPSIGQWVAPTLNPEELERRIEELKTVQFWLEQNAKMLGATIQALEVQRMTLSTLKNMNVQMADLRDSLRIKTPPPEAAPPWYATPAAEPAQAPVAAPVAEQAAAAAGAAPAAPAAPNGTIDPMQWWGALTQQFAELAAAALKDPRPSAVAGASARPARAAKPASPAPRPAAAAKPAKSGAGAAARGNDSKAPAPRRAPAAGAPATPASPRRRGARG